MNIGIGSGDGNSIFEVAAKYVKMQLREMRKNIETIKQGLRSGTDTGSIKFLDDMKKLSGLVLQLKVKTGFIVSDDLDDVVDDEIERAKIELDYEKIVNQTYSKVDAKQLETPDIRIGDTQYTRWLNDTKTGVPDTRLMTKLLEVMALKKVYLDLFEPAGKMQNTGYAVYKAMDAEINRLKSLVKSEMNTIKIMSTTEFEKLNTISDTIPNIIKQILSLALGISKIVVTKITEWSTEITNEDLSKVIDTSNELIKDITLVNSKAGVQPYITIYKKL
jgi:ribosomal protein S17